MPYYKSNKEPILFECILGDFCTNSIEIENNTHKNIVYKVNYEGS